MTCPASYLATFLLKHCSISKRNAPRLAYFYSMPTPSKDTRSKNDPLMHLILGSPADMDLCETTVLHLGYVVLSNTAQPVFPDLSFDLSFQPVKHIINKDHKQVTAFIPLKFMVQKRSFSGRQHWLLFGGSFPHSLATRQQNQGLLVA